MDAATNQRRIQESRDEIRARRRVREAGFSRESQVRIAHTAEERDGETWVYPRWNATDKGWLPIVFDEYRIPAAVKFRKRSGLPKTRAVSPVGWLPPETRVEVAYDGRRWRIVDSPILMHGRTTTVIGAGSCGDEGSSASSDAGSCSGSAAEHMRLGRGLVHVYRECGAGQLTGQHYKAGHLVKLRIYNPGEEVDAGKCVSFVRDRNGRWCLLTPDLSLRGVCLAEDHPGRGVVFDVHLGDWNPDTNEWDYRAGVVPAIDWRFGVPYPDAGATGLFISRLSTQYGRIWECVSLDCSSPGPCGG